MNISLFPYHSAIKAIRKIYSLHRYYYRGRNKTGKESERDRYLRLVTLPWLRVVARTLEENISSVARPLILWTAVHTIEYAC